MRRALQVLLAACLLVGISGLRFCPQAAARGRGKQDQQAVVVMKVGGTRELDGRHFKSPRIQHPGIVKLIRHRKINKYTMKARKRGVTYLSFKAPISPHPKGKKTIRVKIIVR